MNLNVYEYAWRITHTPRRPPKSPLLPMVNHWRAPRTPPLPDAAFWHKQMATTTLDQREWERERTGIGTGIPMGKQFATRLSWQRLKSAKE